MSNLPVPVPPRLPAPNPALGNWSIAAFIAQLLAAEGIDAVQRWLAEEAPAQGVPQVPTNPRTCAPDPCWDPVEAAEFKEMEDAARCGCDEDW